MTEHSSLAKVGERARTDPAFKAWLLADPVAALTAMGVSVPSGIDIKVVENTATLVHLVLPSLPTAAGELSERQLGAVQGGSLPLGASFPLTNLNVNPLGDSYILW
jgi:hypothetical protein